MGSPSRVYFRTLTLPSAFAAFQGCFKEGQSLFVQPELFHFKRIPQAAALALRVCVAWFFCLTELITRQDLLLLATPSIASNNMCCHALSTTCECAAGTVTRASESIPLLAWDPRSKVNICPRAKASVWTLMSRGFRSRVAVVFITLNIEIDTSLSAPLDSFVSQG